MRREWPTDIGPVDLMCRDDEDGWVAVEIKRIGTIDAVEQLSRYLERIRLDPAMADCRGVLAAQVVKPQARVLAEARGLDWVEVDLAELRGEREPALTLFGMSGRRAEADGGVLVVTIDRPEARNAVNLRGRRGDRRRARPARRRRRRCGSACSPARAARSARAWTSRRSSPASGRTSRAAASPASSSARRASR